MNTIITVRSMRHGEKGPDGNLTQKGKEQSEQVAESIKARIIAVSSSPIERVFETVDTVRGNTKKSTTRSTRRKEYLWMKAFSEECLKEFNKKVQEFQDQGFSSADAQNQTALSFLRGEFASSKPMDVAGPFLIKLEKIMKRLGRLKSLPSDDMFLLGTHQTVNESIIHVLAGDELPEEWEQPFEYSEFADFEVIEDEGIMSLCIQFRGQRIVISEERISGLVQAYRNTQKSS